MQAHSREYQMRHKYRTGNVDQMCGRTIPSIRKMGEITTPLLPSLPENTMRNVFHSLFFHSSFLLFLREFLPPKLRNEFPEKSDSYPFFVEVPLLPPPLRKRGFHRYVNSFCPATGRSPSGLLCQHGKQMYRQLSAVQLDFVFFLYIQKSTTPPANARRCTYILVASLRWHDPNQVRSKIYLPLSLSHRLPRFYCFYIVVSHSTDLIFCQQLTFRMTLPLYSNVDFTTLSISHCFIPSCRMQRRWQLPHSGIHSMRHMEYGWCNRNRQWFFGQARLPLFQATMAVFLPQEQMDHQYRLTCPSEHCGSFTNQISVIPTY